MSNLNGKVALITGAGRGIGKTIARALAQAGMLVAINDVDPTRAEGACATGISAGAAAVGGLLKSYFS